MQSSIKNKCFKSSNSTGAAERENPEPFLRLSQAPSSLPVRVQSEFPVPFPRLWPKAPQTGWWEPLWVRGYQPVSPTLPGAHFSPTNHGVVRTEGCLSKPASGCRGTAHTAAFSPCREPWSRGQHQRVQMCRLPADMAT